MSELTDDQLDGLFRKSAEEFDPPFDPAAWQDMKTRLDTHDNPTPGGTPLWKNLLRWGVPIGLLLLLTIGAWYIYRTDFAQGNATTLATATLPQRDAGTSSELPATGTQAKKTGVSQAKQNDSVQTTPNDLSAQSIDDKKQPAVLLEPVSENTARDSGIEAGKPSTSSLNGLTKKTTTDPTDATNENSVAYRLKNVRTKTDRINATPTRIIPSAGERTTLAGTAGKRSNKTAITARFSTKKQGRTNRIRKTEPFVVSNDAVISPSLFSTKSVRKVSKSAKNTVLNTTETIIQPSNYREEAAGLPDVKELAIRPARWSKALGFRGRSVEVAAAVQPDTFYQRIAPKLPTERGLSIRFAVAPDLSTVGLKNFARPGTNVGALVEYRIASRWSVQVGLIQSTKVYKASTAEYTVPPGMWTKIPKPESVDGRCNMFDIPINIRYDVALRPRQNGLMPSRWFVSSGVTSYIMKDEDYYYTYPPHVYTGSAESSASTGGYGFSHLNISTGYERALTKRLSWQVEPFLKMPLRGVGLFKINLISTGAFFSIRYKL